MKANLLSYMNQSIRLIRVNLYKISLALRTFVCLYVKVDKPNAKSCGTVIITAVGPMNASILVPIV